MEMYDVAILGASAAGCAAAIFLVRQGARVALIDRKSDANSYKRVCTHYLQPSAVPTIERLGLASALETAGAARPSLEIWTPSGWIYDTGNEAEPGFNIRREKLDPLLLRTAEGFAGVDVFLGHTFQDLLYDRGRVSGLSTRSSKGTDHEFRAKLVVGADGRRSRVAESANSWTWTRKNKRIAFYGYFENVQLPKPGVAQAWYANPDIVSVFPSDNDVVMVSVMPINDGRVDWNSDRETKLVEMLESMPNAPKLSGAKRIGPILGMTDIPVVWRRTNKPGIALIGDAAFAPDPIWGVGCGWALQSAEWLAESLDGAFVSETKLDRALNRFRSAHFWRLGGHALHMANYASGRPFYSFERLLFSAATKDKTCARSVHAFGHRNAGVTSLMNPLLFARAIFANARPASAELAQVS